MTKEEIQAQIDVILEMSKYFGIDEGELNIGTFTEKLDSAKSIKDLQREAFEAGRAKEFFYPKEYYGEFKYEIFEDYLNSK